MRTKRPESERGARRKITASINGIKIQLRRRSDGGLRVCSDAMPGLILSGADWWQVMSDIPTAIKVIKAHKAKRAVGTPAAGRPK